MGVRALHRTEVREGVALTSGLCRAGGQPGCYAKACRSPEQLAQVLAPRKIRTILGERVSGQGHVVSG